MKKNKIIIGALVALALVVAGGFYFTQNNSSDEDVKGDIATEVTPDEGKDELTDGDDAQTEGDDTDVEGEVEGQEEGDVTEETNSAKAIYDALVLEELGGRAMGDMSADGLALYGLSEEVVAEFGLYITQMMPGMDEIFVAKVVDGKMDDVLAALDARLEVLKTEKAFYPDDQDVVEAAQIFENGDYVMLYVNGDFEAAPKALEIFNELTK